MMSSSKVKDWFIDHWLLMANFVAGLYIGLPYLAPVLAHYEHTLPATIIYRIYSFTCHQLPSRSFHIFEHQGAICHRCTAIWAAFFIGGLIYIFVQHKIKMLPFHWWIIALIPIGLDGGTQLMGPFYQLFPNWGLSLFAVVVWLGLWSIMYVRGVRQWQYYLFVLCFPIGMFYVHFTGSRLSNWQLRTLTGSLFGLAQAWLIFPLLAEIFQDIQQRRSSTQQTPAR